MSTSRITYTLEPSTPADSHLTGFRWFWAMVVRGFNPEQHCMKCLIGRRVAPMRHRWATGEAGRVTVELAEGELLYICGVSEGYVWADNFHLALKPSDGSVSAPTYNGALVRVEGAEALSIPTEPAASKYSRLDSSFLTCRNFQFGAAYFPK